MATLTAHRRVRAPAPIVWEVLIDYRHHHPAILPAAFSNLAVVAGGRGAGTELTSDLTLLGTTRRIRSVIAEPEPGRVLAEVDPDSQTVTRFVVTPAEGGCDVTIETTWPTAPGLGGWLAGVFGNALLQRLYAEELDRLDAYAARIAAA